MLQELIKQSPAGGGGPPGGYSHFDDKMLMCAEWLMLYEDAATQNARYERDTEPVIDRLMDDRHQMQEYHKSASDCRKALEAIKIEEEEALKEGDRVTAGKARRERRALKSDIKKLEGKRTEYASEIIDKSNWLQSKREKLEYAVDKAEKCAQIIDVLKKDNGRLLNRLKVHTGDHSAKLEQLEESVRDVSRDILAVGKEMYQSYERLRTRESEWSAWSYLTQPLNNLEQEMRSIPEQYAQLLFMYIGDQKRLTYLETRSFDKLDARQQGHLVQERARYLPIEHQYTLFKELGRNLLRNVKQLIKTNHENDG